MLPSLSSYWSAASRRMVISRIAFRVLRSDHERAAASPAVDVTPKERRVTKRRSRSLRDVPHNGDIVGFQPTEGGRTYRPTRKGRR
jgi:hypothetical protein